MSGYPACDWCEKRIWPWQPIFVGRLYTSHQGCHDERRKLCHLEYLRAVYPADLDLPGSPRWDDLVADGVVPPLLIADLTALSQQVHP